MGFFIFTFHDVSINTYVRQVLTEALANFTFHDVSINTISFENSFILCAALHSTMFLLILRTARRRCAGSRALHSTMFLLIQVLPLCNPPARKSLHSTMFLLILRFRSSYQMHVILYIPRCFY